MKDDYDEDSEVEEGEINDNTLENLGNPNMVEELKDKDVDMMGPNNAKSKLPSKKRKIDEVTW